MARIRRIEILNFRGIQNLHWSPSPGINCLIGPGDSGKSTVLDAIDLCLGARRNLQFYDTDFFGLDITRPISITLTLGDLDDSMKTLDGYGAFLHGYNATTGLIEEEPGFGAEVVLRLNLTVGSDLEPSWSLVSARAAQQNQTKALSWKDRVALAPTRIGAMSEYNLGWQRGSVLNRLSEERADASAVLVMAARAARDTFGDQAEKQLAGALGIVSTTAQELGISIGTKAKALLDSHSISLASGTVSLHSEDGIPLRGLGVGSTRLLIAGLQRKAANQSTIVLSDELEYGLEPHRIIRFLTSLGSKDAQPLQAFLTTHSPVALRELSGSQLFVLRPVNGNHQVVCVGADDEFQSTIRLYPDAFLATSVIVCEGASEVGFLRGLDLFRISQGSTSLSALGVALVDAGGGTPDRCYQRASIFQTLGYRTMVLRDDDVKPTDEIEKTFVARGGYTIAWRAGRTLEDEIFNSLTPNACLQLIHYAYELHDAMVEEHVRSASNNSITLQSFWAEFDHTKALTEYSRSLLGRASRVRKAGWFKSITWMEEASRNIIGPDLHQCDQEFCRLVNYLFMWASYGGR